MNPVAGAYYGSIVQADEGVNVSYNALLVSLNHRFSAHFTTLLNYTYSHCISDQDFGSELSVSYYENPLSRTLDRGNCVSDVRHMFNGAIIATSPVKGGGLKGRLLAGWQVATIVTASSGLAITINTGLDNSLNGIGNDRPNQILLNPDLLTNATTWFNPAAFADNAIGTFGNVGRDSVYGPGLFGCDMSLSRSFQYRERYRLETRVEAFNAFNHVNYGTPDTYTSDSTFGQILGAADPRILQLSLKLHF